MNESQRPATSKSAVRLVANAQLKPPCNFVGANLFAQGFG
jgi:hypothetical protein